MSVHLTIRLTITFRLTRASLLIVQATLCSLTIRSWQVCRLHYNYIPISRLPPWEFIDNEKLYKTPEGDSKGTKDIDSEGRTMTSKSHHPTSWENFWTGIQFNASQTWVLYKLSCDPFQCVTSNYKMEGNLASLLPSQIQQQGTLYYYMDEVLLEASFIPLCSI